MEETRNILNRFWGWTVDQIKADLEPNRHNFSSLCLNIDGDFNIGTVIRNSNAFLGEEVIIFGRKRYDRRGTVGTHWYENLNYVKIEEQDNSEEKLLEIFSKFDIVYGIDNVPEAKPIEDYVFDTNKKVLFVFGEEGKGIPNDFIKHCNEILMIKQYGSVRSINVGCASAITMFRYCQCLD
jgi:tRNA G18 (ribose-2'-O)-methylase SpoU